MIVDQVRDGRDKSIQNIVRIIIRFFQIVPLLAFIGFLGTAVVRANVQLKILHSGQQTKGIVVAFVSKGPNGFNATGRRSIPMSSPVVMFRQPGTAKEIRFSDDRLDSRVLSLLGRPGSTVGQEVSVIYDPKCPDQAVLIDYGWLNWVQVAALAVMAGAFFIFWWKIRSL